MERVLYESALAYNVRWRYRTPKPAPPIPALVLAQDDNTIQNEEDKRQITCRISPDAI
ncbi:hypothetical protein BU26DRAFT_523656 [Trematosphaeria pertusa]|uniref:Uncharacterized protein n=1 Tax=Trematosphaeria pertusa TaxID=390896 RepID=A0A6A6I168_9PLEO|nr:uncharacterized protein BU26DRAFT_523656 [Trematosphaeria pertusa]KAF2243320.1 hypothetical protein BU26DRAFT_523656 [Trematosphaeria pertusa]